MDLQCPFCGNNRKIFLKHHLYDVEKMYFYEDDDFSVSPDLSPLIKGHLLIIPRQHFNSFGEIKDISIIQRIREVSSRLLGSKDLLYFEHGAVIPGEGGASVDHAHLHVMPRPTDMNIEKIDTFIRLSGFVPEEKILADQAILNNFFLNAQPYIYYEIFNIGYAYPVNDIPHQFLRMMLQHYTKLSYNWRETYLSEKCRNNVRETIEYINKMKV